MSKKIVNNFIVEIVYEEFPIIKIDVRPGFRAIKRTGNFEIDFIDTETEGILFKSVVSPTGGWSRCHINDKDIRVEIKNQKGLIIFSEVIKKYENNISNDIKNIKRGNPSYISENYIKNGEKDDQLGN